MIVLTNNYELTPIRIFNMPYFFVLFIISYSLALAMCAIGVEFAIEKK